jgi:D-arabinose 1-dehydrogenase-like Zn-dependent alcohol dehydrogenase
MYSLFPLPSQNNLAMRINAFSIVFGERSIIGSLTGKAVDNQDTFDFSLSMLTLA